MLQMLIGRLDLCNFVHVLQANSACCLVTGLACPLFDACRLLQKVGHRGRLGDECEGAIRLDCDEGRSGHPRFDVCRTSIELLAKVH